MAMTVQELQKLLEALVKNGQVLPHAEIVLAVNEDFAELDFLDPEVPDYRHGNPNGQVWLMGTSDDEQTTGWTIAGSVEEE